MDVDITIVLDAIIEEVPKKGLGRPLTTGLYVGKREKEAEKTRVRRKEERERKATKALSSTVPTGSGSEGRRRR